MEMKTLKKLEEAEIKVIKFDKSDVVATSGIEETICTTHCDYNE